MKPASWFSAVIGLFLILLIAFAVRWYNLPQRGIISRDEAWYIYSARGLEARFLDRFTQDQEISPISQPALPDFERISSNNVAGKPTYVIILWLFGLLRGSWNYEDVLGLSLFAGLAHILAVYWLSRQAQLSQKTALLAGLSAALSFTGVYFSRIGYPHAFLITIQTIALCLYLQANASKSFPGLLFLAGLFWGIGLSMHMSLVLALPGLLITELYRYRTKVIQTPKILLQRICFLGGGILCVLLSWEISYRIAPAILGSGQGLISLSGSFFGDLIKHAESGGINSAPFTSLTFYGFALLGLENPLTSLFFSIGFISVWQKKTSRETERVLALFFAANFLVLVIYPAQYGRQLAPLISIWPVFVAVGLSVLLESRKKYAFLSGDLVANLAIFLICLFNLYWMWPLINAESTGWVKAARWIQFNAAPEDWIFTNEISDAAMLDYYLPGRVLLWPSPQVDELPSRVRWYVQNPTTRFVPASAQLQPLITGKLPSATLEDPWLKLRPHSVIGGDWLLIPWWRWSAGPKSYQPGVDDVIEIYQVP